MLQQFVADREALAATKGITLALEVEPECLMIEGDQHLLEQVLSILITNALAYTPPGGQVTVRSATFVSNGQGWAGFRISDTGPGISADEQQHLFERFFRGYAGRASNVPGTGLGLAIAKEIIDRHKGRIEVASEVGQGTVFSVWLASTPLDE
jgi:signal transduction histidine kinase